MSMRIGINTFLFTSPFTNLSTPLFAKFKRWGFDSVEIAVEHPEHIDPAFVKRELERHGLVCGSLCACFGPDRDLRGTAQQRRNSLRSLEQLLDYLEVLDCPSLIGPLYSATGRAEPVSRADYRRQWNTVVNVLKPFCAKAARRGRQVCLEPLNRFETDFINTCAQALDMIQAVGSPALKILLDTFHMNIEEKHPADAIRQAGPHLGHVHAAGSDRGTPGKDHTDWKGIAAALREIRYRGDIVIESFTPDVKVIARAASIWRRIEPTRDEIAREGQRFLRHLLNARRATRVH